MILVTVINISVSFLGKELFQNVGFKIEPGDRIGLVGPNGSGKTTLLRLLKGEILPDSGEIIIAKGCRIGYLPQHIEESLSGTLLESLIYSVPGRRELEAQVMALEDKLRKCSHSEQQERLAARLAGIHQEISRLDSEYPAHMAQKILVGLGFKEADFDKPIASLSGGWKMRAALASLLYQKPELLLLDEPTNHLDLPSVQWLEEFLQEFRGALVLISHDRDFLNRQIKRTIAFEPDAVKYYHGNYDFYLKAREEERRILEAKAKNQEQKIKEAQRFIDRFKAKASKARQAQSKIKLVKKMELVKTFKKEKAIHFEFPPVERSGRLVISVEGISKGFGNKILYSDIHLNVLRGERVAVIGPNGSGKTTLLKLLGGEIAPDSGRIKIGHGVKIGYFAQHHSDMLDPQKTVIQEVHQSLPNATIGFIRNVCGAFLFSGQDVEKPVGVLSGGERARVLLAKLLVNPGNLMIMDEPTNHLDIVSSEILIDALEKYTGTLVFVSHNKSFINRLATKIWDVDNGTITEYPGNLNEYNDHTERIRSMFHSEETEGENESSRPAQMEIEKRRKSKKELKRERAERRRQIQEALNPILSGIEEIERQISEDETRQKQLEALLSDPEIFKDSEKTIPLVTEYNEIKKRLDNLLVQWEEYQEQLENKKRELGVL